MWEGQVLDSAPAPPPPQKTSPGIKTVIRIYSTWRSKFQRSPPPFPPHAWPNLGFPKPIPGQVLQLHGPGKLEGVHAMVHTSGMGALPRECFTWQNQPCVCLLHPPWPPTSLDSCSSWGGSPRECLCARINPL